MPLPRFDIDPDIRRAKTLPSAVYHDPAWWRRQRERLFPRTWHAAPEPWEPPGPGELRPWRFLEGCLSEPLLLARDRGGVLRCMSNVCTHRGNILVGERCRADGIRCGYHGRRFGLDGRVLSMPEFDDVEGFPGPTDHLPVVPHRLWGGISFASLEPRVALDESLSFVEDRVGFIPLDDLRVDGSATRTYDFDANWALYCDNYLEGFHIPHVHPGLRAVLDYASYETELFPSGVLQVGIASEGQAAFELPRGHRDHGRRVAAYYFWLFPCTMLNFYPWGLSINVVLPRGPTQTRVVFSSRVWKQGDRGQGAGAGLDVVEREDEEVVLAVQDGVRSGLYDRGRYSPRRERGVHHFHRMLAESLGAGEGDP